MTPVESSSTNTTCFGKPSAYKNINSTGWNDLKRKNS